MRMRKQTRNRHEAVTTRRGGAAILDTVTPAQENRPADLREGSVSRPVARSPRGDAFRDVLAVAPGLVQQFVAKLFGQRTVAIGDDDG